MLSKISLLLPLLLLSPAVMGDDFLDVFTSSSAHCKPFTDQGETEIDAGSTGVVKMSNAKAISIASNNDGGHHCAEAYIHYFHVEECKNPPNKFFHKEMIKVGTEFKCHKLPNIDHKCAKIACSKSSN